MAAYPPPPPAAPPAPRSLPPRQLWSQLTPDQQRPLRQILLLICRELVRTPAPPPEQEASHE